MPTPANGPGEDVAMVRETGEGNSPASGVERGRDEPDIWLSPEAGDLAAAEEDEAVRRAAEYLERRQADARIRDILANADFQGPYWEEFAEGLIRYGYAVIGAWVRTGLIFTHCSSAGIGLAERRYAWSSEDQDDLVQDTIFGGLIMFRRALSEGRWTLHGGASLKTYFIGACQRAFANAYRRWLRETEATLAVGRDPADVLSSRADPMADVEAAALTSLAVGEGLARLDRRTRAVMLLKAAGYSHDEIAEITGTTPGAVEGIVYRHRKRISEQDSAAGSTAAARGGSRRRD